MQKTDKETKILTTIEEITGKPQTITAEDPQKTLTQTRPYHIHNLLIIASSYDFFLLEEDGRVQNILTTHAQYDPNNPPHQLIHAETTKDAIEHINQHTIDAILIFNDPPDSTHHKIIHTIREITDKPIIILHNDLTKIYKIKQNDVLNQIHQYFTWNGDGAIITSIIQLIEDQKNIQDSPNSKYSIILVIEDSIQHYSTHLSTIYQTIQSHITTINQEELTRLQQQLRYKRRPYVLHTTTYEDAEQIINKHKKQLLCVITDNNFTHNHKSDKNAGITIATHLNKSDPTIPILLQSSEPINSSYHSQNLFEFVSKNEPDINQKLTHFIKKIIGAPDLILPSTEKEPSIKISSLHQLNQTLLTADINIIKYACKHHLFSTWLQTRYEYDLATEIRHIENTEINDQQLRKLLLDIYENYRYATLTSTIGDYHHTSKNPNLKLTRIGKGALGGKARGLAFLQKLITKYLPPDLFPTLTITIPRTIVLSTDIFESFLQKNNLLNKNLFNLPDDRIAMKFMKASLPPTIIGDLRKFIRNTRKPIIIRSSGLLEDSLLQPFAGIYASMLLSNESWETDIRFQEVTNAIKYVYASTYFEKARTYIKSTPKHISDEKMAVIIQEVVGQRHGTYFYPTISGVAKSYNYYSSKTCKPEDGIVYLALGLGKAIVDGGASYCFCPTKPKKPLSGTPKEYMKYAQTYFYSLNLQSIYRTVHKTEDTTLTKLNLKTAKNHGQLKHIASTYVPADDRLYPGLSENGAPVINFSPIVNYNAFPLAKALHTLLSISEIALGYPVEIEFAVNIAKDQPKHAELVILQIRNMIPPNQQTNVHLESFNQPNVLLHSTNALGNGIYKNLSNIIYVTQEDYDMSRSQETMEQIRKLNTKLLDTHTPYILIGPGRWGSSDPWLGIPVAWSDIAGAKVIIETPYKHRAIDPSQGSHFFHDMIAANVAYIITKSQTENIDWSWLNNQKIIEELPDIRHIKTKTPLTVMVDGKKGRALIKQNSKP